jgi:hypothetical protein
MPAAIAPENRGDGSAGMGHRRAWGPTTSTINMLLAATSPNWPSSGQVNKDTFLPPITKHADMKWFQDW